MTPEMQAQFTVMQATIAMLSLKLEKAEREEKRAAEPKPKATGARRTPKRRHDKYAFAFQF